MEVSLSGSCHLKIGNVDENLGLPNFRTSNLKMLFPKSRIRFGQLKDSDNRKFGVGSSIKDVQSEVIQAENKNLEQKSTISSSNSVESFSLFVGLPLDTVSKSNKINHERAITAGLKALKLMGVDGVELSIWWGIVEKEAMGIYDWSGYHAIAKLVQEMGLKLRVALNFHACLKPKISLPDWVRRVGEADPSVYFTDRSGKQYKECLSLAVDDLPIFGNRSPIQVYQDFCESFKSTFSSFMGSTITVITHFEVALLLSTAFIYYILQSITVGLGPDGELRYPSCHLAPKTNNHSGIGEFQCYDKYMLRHLKKHAEETGNPMWGLEGPHDVPKYDETPLANAFFKDDGGSWESTYGDFFLSWYPNQHIYHGTRFLSTASTVFSEMPVTIYGKLPLVHSWNKSRAHPSELTTGFYNTAKRDGYEAIVEMFAMNSCRMILPGMDLSLLSDTHQPTGSSPQSLLGQIKESCKRHGVGICGENLSLSKVADGFIEIKENLSEHKEAVDTFTYQRMGADFFSPNHFPLFTAFVRAINQLDLDTDDMPEIHGAVECVVDMSSQTLQVQAA